MKYRSSTEIIDSMLRSIRSGATKTHIMYRAYMSYSQLKEYLKLLEERQTDKVRSRLATVRPNRKRAEVHECVREDQ